MVPDEWALNTLFKGFSEEQLAIIAPHIISKEYTRNEVIMEDGDLGQFMFMISSGSVSVYKNELKLAELSSGEFVGMMALIDTSPRSATVLSGSHGVRGFIIEKKGFTEILESKHASVVSKLLLNYVTYQQNSLRKTNELSLEEARARYEEEHKRVISATFFGQMVLGLVIFTFLLGFLNDSIAHINSTYISFIILSIYGSWSYFFVRNSSLPLKAFGLTMENFKPAIRIALWSSAIFIGMLFGLKWTMISFFPEHFGDQLIELYQNKDGWMGSAWLIIPIYCIHAVIQEFIARASIQGGLLEFISGKYAGWQANILATLMFSSFHIMLDVRVAFLTIIPGLFWGYLFYKNRNFLAVAISHVLIGLVAFFVLNLLA